MRPRISIRGFVRRSVRGSIHPSVGHAFLKCRGNGDFKQIKHQGTHRIAFFWWNSRKFKKIQQNSRKFKKIQENSAKFIGRIIVWIKFAIIVLYLVHTCHFCNLSVALLLLLVLISTSQISTTDNFSRAKISYKFNIYDHQTFTLLFIVF